uniref:SFRICE_007147 n=1 Tax=Spodoptera frugiperda TaxID=7108 RepID=A0A2H1V9A2_SPOFR
MNTSSGLYNVHTNARCMTAMGGALWCAATRRSMRYDTYSSYNSRIRWNEPNDAADLGVPPCYYNIQILHR